MSATRTAFLGSSSTVGTDLSSPTTERYEALFRTYIRNARSSHCRTGVYAVAALGLYEEQATGYSIPGNRSGAVSIDTNNNITAALSFKPHVLILHHPAGNMPEAINSWGFTTETALKGFMASAEQLGLVQNIYSACLSAGVEFRIMGSHPVAATSLSAAEQAANLNVVRKYWNDMLKATYGYRFIEYWSSIDDGSGNGNASLLTPNGRHCNTSGLVFVEAALEAAGLSTVNNRTTPLDIDP